MSSDVISRNFFDLLGDDESGESPVVKPAAAKKDAAPAKKEAPKKAVERAPRNEYPRRGGARGGAVEGAAPRAPRAPRETGDFEHPREVRAGEGERRERGAARGGRGGRGGARGRGREFDRHSGTGRTDGVKKEVAGKGSWGNPLTAEEEAKKEIIDAEGATEKAEVAAEATEGAAPAEPKEQDPEENFKTLEQYIAEKARPATDAKVRKANEGADDAQWKDAVVLKKAEDEELFADLLKTKKSKAAAAKKDAKTFVNIDLRYTDEGRGGFTERGGRGGARGGARGGRGGSERGAPRGARGGARTGGSVSIEDQTAFPSLGGK